MPKRHADEMLPDSLCSRARLDPWAALATGILQQAAEDAAAGDLGAVDWLLDDESEIFSDAAGLDHQAVKRKAAEWEADPAGVFVLRLVQEA